MCIKYDFALTLEGIDLIFFGVFVSFLVMCFLIILIKIQKVLEYPFGKKMDHINLRMRKKAYRRIA